MAISDDNMATIKKMIARQADKAQLGEINRVINSVWKTRNAEADREALATLSQGDRVKFGNNIKPMYLRGRLGTIEEFRSTRITVRLDCGPIGKFQTGRVISHPSSVTKTDSPKFQATGGMSLEEIFEGMAGMGS